MFEQKLLENQVILVTGGGTGLGRSMAARFASLSAKVVILARNLERLEQTAAEIRKETGGEVLSLELDVRRPEMVDAALARVLREMGPVTGLVNNAAGNFLAATEDLSPRGFDAIIDIVLRGSFFMTQAVGRQMIDQRIRGSIVSILTPYAMTGSAFVVPSAMAKAGVLAMTRSLAVEWGTAYGIRLNAVAPGPFPTDGAWNALVPDGAVEEEVKKRIPLRRFGEHKELADLVAYLMSPSAGYINGDCITIDGGGWQKSGGDFNHLTDLDRGSLKKIFASMKARAK